MRAAVLLGLMAVLGGCSGESAPPGSTTAGGAPPDPPTLAPGVSHDGRALRVERVVGARPLCCTNGMMLDGDRLYVDQGVVNSVVSIDLHTKEISRLATPDEPLVEQLVVPYDMWRDPATGDLYQTEVLAGGVRKISPDGSRVRIVTGFFDGVTRHGIGRPNGITGVRRAGEPLRLFVSMIEIHPDSLTGIWEIDPGGRLPPRLVYGAALRQSLIGTGLHAPSGMAFDPGGDELYSPETFGGKLWAIDVDAGTARLVYAGGGSPRSGATSVRFGRDGSLFYNEVDTGRVLELDPRGPPDQTPRLVGQLAEGIDTVAQHDDGRIFVSNFHTGGVGVIHPDGRTEQLYPLSLNLPLGIAPLPDGRVAAADLASLALLDPRADEAERVTRYKHLFSDDLDITIGVAVTGECDAYVTQFFRGTVAHVDLCDPSRWRTEILPRLSFVGPADIAATERELWLTDTVAGEVHVVRGVHGPERATSQLFAAGLLNPTGIAVAGETVYVAEQLAGRVLVFDASLGVPHSVIGGLDRPQGLAVEPDGSLLILEAGKGRLLRVRPSGAREVVLEGMPRNAIRVLPLFEYFSDVAVAANGDILVGSFQEGSLTRLMLAR